LAFVDVESRIPVDHPLRTIKSIAVEALAKELLDRQAGLSRVRPDCWPANAGLPRELSQHCRESDVPSGAPGSPSA
jgi:hypothetical protein